ncbi:hypothetical protein [Jannaschia ovalis]|uniref:MotA/TolQ/ExbB proton channel family protein n=1 Tax=Jannaschia ovalis TaxID=3038773 RepID=A0ABY8LFM1_9RHOB|nr:hypothetical protein [Jannaschia sp. GRR-S6-38]WGH80094.1 hypothetical protein P8627_07470 [Jannaschia sp. GRR-S6-38]
MTATPFSLAGTWTSSLNRLTVGGLGLYLLHFTDVASFLPFGEDFSSENWATGENIVALLGFAFLAVFLGSLIVPIGRRLLAIDVFNERSVAQRAYRLGRLKNEHLSDLYRSANALADVVGAVFGLTLFFLVVLILISVANVIDPGTPAEQEKNMTLFEGLAWPNALPGAIGGIAGFWMRSASADTLREIDKILDETEELAARSQDRTTP